jgi:cytochrome P450
LDAVIKESFRMKPIVPVTARVLSSSDTISGYKWDANTIFFINSISILQDNDYLKDP